MARQSKQQKENKHQVRDYVVFFICAFVLIFLTSSFVIENIYNSAGNIAVTPEGVKEIYLAATGHLNFEEANGAVNEKGKDDSKEQSSDSNQQSAGNQ